MSRHESKRVSGSLAQLASLYGVQSSFVDTFGKRRRADPEVILEVLRLRGCPVPGDGQLRETIAARREELSRNLTSDVEIVWGGRRPSLALNIPKGESSKGDYTLSLEDGNVLTGKFDRDDLRATGEGTPTVSLLDLPHSLPPGYHRIAVKAGAREAESLLLAAPSKAWTRKTRHPWWGVFAPLYAARQERGMGIGDLGTAAIVARWAAAQGANVISTLPLLPTFLGDEPFDPSPYSPVSRLFWNELYLDLTQIPELEESPEAQFLVDSMQDLSRVATGEPPPLLDYRRLMQRKREVLELLARAFFANGASGRRIAFESFTRTSSEVGRYARFRALCEQQGRGWPVWPAQLQKGEISPADFDEERERYHLYVQWNMHDQMRSFDGTIRGEELNLYLDFPLGSHADGYDVWSRQQLFARGVSVGAPPDLSYKTGQNWGFIPNDPDAMRRDGYDYFARCIRHQMKHCGLLRIDHVMGLHRLYWIPNGVSPARGVYVRYPADELYAVLNIESHRNQCIVVGEDLGTVPDYVRETMRRRGHMRLFVLQRQLTHTKKDPPGEILPDMVASLNTHDMPTFAGFWNELDITDRESLGLLDNDGVEREKTKRKSAREILQDLLEKRGLLSTQDRLPDVLEAALTWLAESATPVMLVNLEDLWLEERPQNVPTTTFERPNWRRTWSEPLETIFNDRRIAAILEKIDHARKEKVQ